ncbi:MAG: rod shape-determining protein MreC [candidate division WOR-3 bacterium]
MVQIEKKPSRTKDDNRLFLIFLLLSIILLLLPGSLKFNLFFYPRVILLTPLNLSLRFLAELSQLRQENLRLKALTTQLQIENIGLKEIIRTQVKQLTPPSFDSTLPNFTLKRAQVVSRDRLTLVSYLLLNQGEQAGVKVNMPVIAEMGVVGKVIATSPFQALVETMLSKDSKIAGVDLRSRVTGVVTAHPPNRLRLLYVPRDADVTVGDTIITSGLGGIFPKGFLIGTVVKTNPEQNSNHSALFKDILLKPFVDIYATEAVYIITGETERPKTKRPRTDWDKLLEQFKIEPPIEIKIR